MFIIQDKQERCEYFFIREVLTINSITKLRNWFGRLTLAIKLTIAIALSMSLVLILLVSFTVGRSVAVMKKTFTQCNRAILSMTLQEIDSYYNTLVTYSLSIRNDELFMQHLTSPSSFDYEAEVYIKSLLRNIFYSRDDIDSYTVYLLSVGKGYTISSAEPNVRAFDNPLPAVIPGYAESARLSPYLHVFPSANNGLFTITRTIINVSDDKPLAVVVLDVNASHLTAFSQQNSFDMGTFCLLDSDNRLFYSSNYDVLNSEGLVHLSPYLASTVTGDSPTVTVCDAEYIMISDSSSEYLWRLVKLLPKSVIDTETIRLRNELVLIAIPAAALNLLLIFLFARLLTLPLYALSGKVSGTNVRMPKTLHRISGSAEILMLSQRFDELTAETAQLEQRLQAVQNRRDTAMLHALEAQAVPGIIHDTLASFSGLATRRGHSMLAQITENMASLLDYTSQSGEYALVEDEILFTNNYFHMLRSQASDRFDYHVSADKQSFALMIPKLCLYPLAAATLQRAHASSQDDIFIRIQLRVQGAFLTIIGSDNAPPPAPAHLEELRRQIESASENPFITAGTGLANLSARLRLLYQDQASISIDVIEEKTAITIHLPLAEAE